MPGSGPPRARMARATGWRGAQDTASTRTTKPAARARISGMPADGERAERLRDQHAALRHDFALDDRHRPAQADDARPAEEHRLAREGDVVDGEGVGRDAVEAGEPPGDRDR